MAIGIRTCWGGGALLGLGLMTGCLIPNAEHCALRLGDDSCHAVTGARCVLAKERASHDGVTSGCVDGGEVPEGFVAVPFGLPESIVARGTLDAESVVGIAGALDCAWVEPAELEVLFDGLVEGDDGVAAVRRHLLRRGRSRVAAYDLSGTQVEAIEAYSAVMSAWPGGCGLGGSSGSSSSGGETTTAGSTTTGGVSSGTSTTTTGPECDDDRACSNPAPICDVDRGVCVLCERGAAGDAACAMADPEMPVCAPSGACVECTSGNPGPCAAVLMVCDGEQNECVPCTQHEQCDSGACELVGGQCFVEEVVIHVDGDGGQDFENLQIAIGSVAAGANGVIFLHEQDGGVAYPAASIGDLRTIALFAAEGESPTITGAGGSTGLQIGGAETTVYLRGLSLEGTTDGGRALVVAGATVRAERVTITQNAAGIMVSGGADVGLVNSVVSGNGSGLAGSVGMDIDASTVDLLYVTVARNDAGSVDSIACTADSTVTVRNSIVVGRDAPSIDCPGITATNNAVDQVLAGNVDVGAANPVWFENVATGNFDLSPAGATEFAGIAIWESGDPTTDIEGNPRPTTDGASDYPGAYVP